MFPLFFLLPAAYSLCMRAQSWSTAVKHLDDTSLLFAGCLPGKRKLSLSAFPRKTNKLRILRQDSFIVGPKHTAGLWHLPIPHFLRPFWQQVCSDLRRIVHFPVLMQLISYLYSFWQFLIKLASQYKESGSRALERFRIWITVKIIITLNLETAGRWEGNFVCCYFP